MILRKSTKLASISVDCIIIPDNSRYLINEIVHSSLFEVEHACFHNGRLELNEEIFTSEEEWMTQVINKETTVARDITRHYFNDQKGQIQHALKMHRKGWKLN